MRGYSWHYIILIMIFVVALVGIGILGSNKFASQIIVGGLVVAYVLWGIGHHIIKKDLTGFIVLEYVLVGLLAGTVIATVILQK